jgi:hypothetical protein
VTDGRSLKLSTAVDVPFSQEPTCS